MLQWSPKKIITLVMAAAFLGGAVYYALGEQRASTTPASAPTSLPAVSVEGKSPEPILARDEHDATPEPVSKIDYKRRTIATEAEEPIAIANAERVSELITEPTPMPPPPTTALIPETAPTQQLAPAPTSDPLTPKVADYFQRVWFWLGAGMNFTSYSQTVPGLADVDYGNIKGPSLTARAGSMINESFGMDLGYKETPGEVQSSSNITVIDGSYKWRTLSAEGIYSFTKPSEAAYDNGALALKFGFQQHQMPFMVPVAANTVEVRQNNLSMATVGLEYVVFPRHRLRWEFLARYQHPIQASASSGSSFTVNPKFAVDGSIGQVFRINDQWSLGAFWYGQWHSYSFNYTDTGSGITFDGNQTLFYSTIDMRIGFEF